MACLLQNAPQLPFSLRNSAAPPGSFSFLQAVSILPRTSVSAKKASSSPAFTAGV